MFGGLILRSHQPLFMHDGVERPFQQTLAACTRASAAAKLTPDEDAAFVLLLAEACRCFVGDHAFLGLFLQPATPTRAADFPVFTALVPYMHCGGELGAQAQHALLLCMNLAASRADACEFIVRHSAFCDTLAAGLTGLYSRLPATLPRTKGAWKLHGVDIAISLPELAALLAYLHFCNAALTAAPPPLAEQALRLISGGFLESVVLSALHQEGQHEAAAATAYLDACLRTVTEPCLVREILRFVTLSASEGGLVRTLHLVIGRMDAAEGDLSLTSLRLIHTALDFGCEDVLLELCLRPLQQRQTARATALRLSVPTPATADPNRAAAQLATDVVFSRSARRLLAVCSGGDRKLSPVGFDGYMRDAAHAVHRRAVACRAWSDTYQRCQVLPETSTRLTAATAVPEQEGNVPPGISGGSFWNASSSMFSGLKRSIQKDKAARAVRGPPHSAAGSQRPPLQQKPADDTPGMFLATLLQMLTRMLEARLSSNLLLTAVLARLAEYPQPLLRDFLLGTGPRSPGGEDTEAPLLAALRSVRAHASRAADDMGNDFLYALAMNRDKLSGRSKGHDVVASDGTASGGQYSPRRSSSSNFSPEPVGGLSPFVMSTTLWDESPSNGMLSTSPPSDLLTAAASVGTTGAMSQRGKGSLTVLQRMVASVGQRVAPSGHYDGNSNEDRVPTVSELGILAQFDHSLTVVSFLLA